MDKVGVARFARYKEWPAFAQVSLTVHDVPTEIAGVSFSCGGSGFTAQGHVEGAPAAGYDDWKRGAAAGVRFAFRLLGSAPRPVTVTRIEGLSTDTSPAAVGAAAALAVFNALEAATPASFHALVEEIVFTPAGTSAEFSL
ncbi:hypothetical protein WMF11_49290 [Sorangium sp. So ce295]|uniref:hypothetical protein n=1 Tax=Sorangium sp. So ce295 TaxID=3133295 RepID=UPI003F5E3F88